MDGRNRRMRTGIMSLCCRGWWVAFLLRGVYMAVWRVNEGRCVLARLVFLFSSAKALELFLSLLLLALSRRLTPWVTGNGTI